MPPTLHRIERPAPRPYAALPIAWTAIILLLTLTPAQEMPRTPEWKLLAFDTAAHAGVFGLLAALSWFSLRRQRRWPRLAAHPALAVLAYCIVLGAFIEGMQYVMALGRNPEWSDLLSDSIGAALVLGVLAGGRWLWQRARAGRALSYDG